MQSVAITNMPEKYLFRVTSEPKAGVCDEATWEKWYTEEHIPDLLNHNTATRAAIYREVFDTPSLYTRNEKPNHPTKYMAIYQTEHEEFLKSEGFPKTKSTSDIFPNEKAIPENGDLEARNYELIEVFDPKNLGESKRAP